MIARITIIFLSFIFLHCATSAQTGVITKKTAEEGKAKRLYERALKYADQEMNDKSLKDLNSVLKEAPNFIDAHLLKGGILFNQKKYAEAEKNFEQGIRLKPDYNGKAYYTLAVAEHRQDKFAEAAEHFQNYIDHTKAREQLSKKAKRYINICNFSMTAKKEPVPFKPISIGTNINTKDDEYLPCFSADEEILIYTRVVRGQEDFYYSTQENGEWLAGLPMETINSNNNEGAQTISANGKFLVFTGCSRKDGLGECDLYYSEVRDGRWTPPSNMGAPINTRGWESQPSLSADGNTLYFASTRKGGFGSKDIWVSRRKSNGKWNTPVNLGEQINTTFDDKAPFIHQDGQTLYFMSEGHPGMGGYDLFLSKKSSQGKWSKPKNLGYPINTKGHEGALVISLDGTKAYFATNRKYIDSEESNYSNVIRGNETDIYSFELYDDIKPQPVTYVKATVKDIETNKALVAGVEFSDLATGSLHASSHTDQDGEFLICLPMGKDYALNVAKKKYLFHSENFSLSQTGSLEKPFLLTIELQPIKDVVEDKVDESTAVTASAKPVILKNVFFDTGSANLRSESFIELNKLRDLLNENASIRIQISGHTDNVGTDGDNLSLSENRAKAVYNYLIENGIVASRLAFKGYGETQPIDSNETEEGRQNNRRTEFIVIR